MVLVNAFSLFFEPTNIHVIFGKIPFIEKKCQNNRKFSIISGAFQIVVEDSSFHFVPFTMT